jgi:hypothetical protein
MRFRAEHYYEAALQRIEQATILFEAGTSYALAMYVAGLAVECKLRAFKLRRDSTFDERHDLLLLFRTSGMFEADERRRKKVKASDSGARAWQACSEQAWILSTSCGPTITASPLRRGSRHAYGRRSFT